MHYYMMNISSIKQSDEEHIKNVYPFRYSRALKYKDHSDYLRCLGAYLLLEKALGEFDEKKITLSKTGKPFLEGYPFFNYSHSGDFVVLVVDKIHEVGIDIQVFDEKHSRKFIKEWTKKEAISKLTGEGIRPHQKLALIYKGKRIHVYHKKVTLKYVVSIATI